MANERTTAARQIYPHLPSADTEPRTGPKPGLAEAMYPTLIRKPRAPQSAPKPVRSLEWIRDWSGVDLNYARAVGLIPKGGRR
jgi:hypothetical protein